MRTIWPIGQIKRRIQQNRTKYKNEQPADKAARRTANATWVIAFFTILLAYTSIKTLVEVHEGGKDTHDLAVAAGKQAEAAKIAAEAAKEQSRLLSAQLRGTMAARVRSFLADPEWNGRERALTWSLQFENKGGVYADRSTVDLVFTLIRWPQRSVLWQRKESLPPQDIPPATPEDAGRRVERILTPGITATDVGYLERGEAFLTFQFSINYGNGFDPLPVRDPSVCKAVAIYPRMSCPGGSTRGGGAAPYPCGDEFERSFVNMLISRKHDEEQGCRPLALTRRESYPAY